MAFAEVSDYEARYGEVDDAERVGVLLEDASAFVAAQPGFRLLGEDDGRHGLQQANLVRVVCAVVHRAQTVGGLAGIESYSQTAVDYSATVQPHNPSGDYYLTAAEKRALGIGSGRVGQTRISGGP